MGILHWIIFQLFLQDFTEPVSMVHFTIQCGGNNHIANEYFLELL